MDQPTTNTDIRRHLVAMLPRLRRFALTLVCSVSDADALVRETCKRAIQKGHHWKGEGRIENWLFSTMRGAHADETKKRSSNPASTDETPEAGATGTAGDNILASLPEGLASAMLLVDVEEFSYEETAAILALPQDIVASRLCAARLHVAALAADMMERRA